MRGHSELAHSLATGDISAAWLTRSLGPAIVATLPLHLRIRFARALGRSLVCLQELQSVTTQQSPEVMAEIALAAIDCGDHATATNAMDTLKREDLDRPEVLLARALLALAHDDLAYALRLASAGYDQDTTPFIRSALARTRQFALYCSGALREAVAQADATWDIAAREMTDHLLLSAAAASFPIFVATGQRGRACALVSLVRPFLSSPAISASWVMGQSALLGEVSPTVPVEFLVRQLLDSRQGEAALAIAAPIVDECRPSARTRFRRGRWSLFCSFAALIADRDPLAARYAAEAHECLSQLGLNYFDAHAQLALGLAGQDPRTSLSRAAALASAGEFLFALLPRSLQARLAKTAAVLGLELAHLIPPAQPGLQKPFRATGDDRLTPREHELLFLLCQFHEADLLVGWRRRLAEGLEIEPGTVKRHIENIRAKLGLKGGPAGPEALVLWMRRRYLLLGSTRSTSPIH